MQYVVFSLLTTIFYTIAGAIFAGLDTSGWSGRYTDSIGPTGMAVVIVVGFGLGLWFRYRGLEDRQAWHTVLLCLPLVPLVAFPVLAAL